MANPENIIGRAVTAALLTASFGCLKAESTQASDPKTTPAATTELVPPTSTSTQVPPTELPTATATATTTELPKPVSTSTPESPRSIPTQPTEAALDIPVYTADPEGKKMRIILALLSKPDDPNQELLVAYIRRENCGGQETVSPWVFPAKELRKQGNGFTGGDRARTFSAVPVRDTWRGRLVDRICSNDTVEFEAKKQRGGPEALGSEWIRAHRDIYGAPVYSSASGALDDLAKGCSCAIPRLPLAK